MFHRLSADNIEAERKRHDAAIEALQKAQIEWTHKRQQRIDFINKQLRLERKAETKFTELNDDSSTLSLLLTHSFKSFSSLGGGSPPRDAVVVPPPGNNASTSTPMAIPIAVSIEAIVINFSLNRVLIFSPNQVSLSNTLAIVSLKLII